MKNEPGRDWYTFLRYSVPGLCVAVYVVLMADPKDILMITPERERDPYAKWVIRLATAKRRYWTTLRYCLILLSLIGQLFCGYMLWQSDIHPVALAWFSLLVIQELFYTVTGTSPRLHFLHARESL